MKFGKYPVASVVLLLLFGVKFLSGYFFPERAAALEPVFNIIITVTLIGFVLYYIYLFISMWRKRRDENA